MSMHRKLASTLLTSTLVFPALLRGGEQAAPGAQHVVPAEEFQRRAAAASASRKEHAQKLERFFAALRARDPWLAVILPPARIEQAARMLSDEELAQLAARAEKAEKDFAAGALSNQHLTYIVIALAAAVIVLIAK